MIIMPKPKKEKETDPAPIPSKVEEERKLFVRDAKVAYAEIKDNLMYKGIDIDAVARLSFPREVQKNVHIQIDHGLIETNADLASVIGSELAKHNSVDKQFDLKQLSAKVLKKLGVGA